jgi:peptidoglycan lytic transglycosylase G
VVVPRGGTSVAARALRANDVIASETAFEALTWATLFDGSIHAAEFAFPAHASISQVLTILRTAKPVEHKVTIPEGLTAVQIARVVRGADAASGPVAVPPEGAVLPQTYAYDRGMTRESIIHRAEAAMTRALAAAWANRAPNLPLATPRDLLILASIVERETAKPEERPHIAAVYLNRLRLGMKLQADPTVVYAVSHGTGVLDHRLDHDDLEVDSPYNTYKYGGLPPGPICSPGVASLAAASHPAASQDLYFVADGSGGHAFARTREQHLRNVARWRGLRAAEPASTGASH